MGFTEAYSTFLNSEKTIVSHLQTYIDKIESTTHLNCFVRVFKEEALLKARELDAKISTGKSVGKLAGCVIGIKDNISIKDQPLTCGSRILKGYKAKYNAHVINELEKEDAILIGHLNMDEFAMGSTTETSCYGVTKNNINESHVPGGSSGGSAVAVSAGLVDIALGSDTGGSIRQPAAFTGVFGFKPTYGAVSRSGLVAFSSSLDQIGPFTKTSEDLALILDVLYSKDKNDSTSIETNFSFSDELTKSVEGKKIGIPFSLLKEGVSKDILNNLDLIISNLKENGVEIIDIELPHLDKSIPVYYMVATAEASANLQRFDGVRYGLRADDVSGLDDMYKQTRSEGFGEEVKRRIALGTFVLSHGYFDAYYRKAQKVRRLIKNDFDSVFKSCDFILLPTTPTTAFKIGEFEDDPIALYLADVFTAGVNLAGNPAISIPTGKDSNGLPIGMQVISSEHKDDSLLNISSYLEKCFGSK